MSEWLERYSVPIPEAGCFLYVGCLNGNGYGLVKHDGKTRQAHRVSYELACGPIPKGKMLCHTCDVRSCVNPKHLYPGTNSDNQKDARRRGRHHQSNKTQCPSGHAYSAENTYIWRERRYCRICVNGYTKAWREAR